MAVTVTQTIAPTLEPLTLAQAKKHARVDGNDEDELFTELIKAARSQCEKWMRRSLINRTYLLKADYWGEIVDYVNHRNAIVLPYPPLSSVSSIKYYDTDGVQQTWDSGQYVVDTATTPGSVCLAYNSDGWPTHRSQPNAIEITFIAGYGASGSSVPEDIQLALRMAVTHWYYNREAPAELPDAVKMQLGSYAIWQ